eukprot:CAMPEP_0184407718 /NCGR_PEP_ID=MMETSP0738-20130409/2640_1 /TAXON_ID=385413 /ORGANISM="Thalassiosira miniscula, Strain CCMP1093" /LENGTH=84 /DNA_ID=CAMNT_0026764949 /DNA_START=97 /DNA_END=351 /DNA_ORIENTATION=-
MPSAVAVVVQIDAQVRQHRLDLRQAADVKFSHHPLELYAKRSNHLRPQCAPRIGQPHCLGPAIIRIGAHLDQPMGLQPFQRVGH